MYGEDSESHHRTNDEAIISWQTVLCHHVRRSMKSITHRGGWNQMSRSVKRKRGGNAIRWQVHHCNEMALALRLEVRKKKLISERCNNEGPNSCFSNHYQFFLVFYSNYSILTLNARNLIETIIFYAVFFSFSFRHWNTCTPFDGCKVSYDRGRSAFVKNSLVWQVIFPNMTRQSAL